MIPVVAIVAFLVGAAASAFAAALYLRRTAAVAGPVAAPAPTAGLASRALGALDVGVVVLDRDETVVFANPVSRRMLVVDGDRLTLPVLSELVRSVTDSAQPDSVTLDLSTPGRGPEQVSFLVRAMPLRDGGRVGSVVLRFSDITEARRLELVRRDFVANVSHELKTPVSALTLLAEAVQEAADDPEAVQHFAGRMQREGSRLGRLVQELIELSRLQGAEALPGQHLVSIDRIVGEAVDRSRLLAEQNGIAVAERTEPGLQVRGNETQLSTALGNLVDNAIAYSPASTRVAVTGHAVTDPDGTEWVEIAVTDQGIGIAESDLDRVFERFYRVDQARSRATGGTGLGLAIVKHIATNHGGRVSVWSVVGAGSTFTMRLPLAGRAAVEPAAPIAGAASAGQIQPAAGSALR
ncbi:MAG: two-component system, OmpR family, sensor histidine kinase SenX3 [Pseudonocardiales bacterium]|nr:two-component system, OmpR family, sensor histidine kinase SenX3 [Pseudonocardiales bacterium]